MKLQVGQRIEIYETLKNFHFPYGMWRPKITEGKSFDGYIWDGLAFLISNADMPFYQHTKQCRPVGAMIIKSLK